MEQSTASVTAENEFAQTLAALARDDTISALYHVERALKLRDHAGWYSYLGLCVARERGQQRRGVELCQDALAAEPDNPDHFLNLGRIYLLMGDRATALRVLREGMAKGGGEQLGRVLNSLGERRPPVLSFFPRQHPLNRYLGLLLHRLRLR